MHLNHTEHGIKKIERLPRVVDPLQTQFKVFFNSREDLDRFLFITPRAITWQELIDSKRPGLDKAFRDKALKINALGYALVGGEDYREQSVVIKEYPQKLEETFS